MSHWSLVMSHMTFLTLTIILWKYFRIYANFLRKSSFVYICRHRHHHRIIRVARWHIFVKNANSGPKFTNFPPKKAPRCNRSCATWWNINLQIDWYFRQLTSAYCTCALRTHICWRAQNWSCSLAARLCVCTALPEIALQQHRRGAVSQLRKTHVSH